jgi:thioredoxin 1
MPQEQELTNRNFAEQVLRSEVPVLVDFWAPWCGPCRAMMPVVDKLAKESGGRYRVAKVNVDQFPDIAKYYGISGVPTLLLFHRGRMVKAFQGVQAERTLRAALDRVSPQLAADEGSNSVLRWLGLE